MINLKERPAEGLNISRMSHPVDEGTVTLSNYLNRSGDLAFAPFWSSGALAYNMAQRPPMVHWPDRPVIQVLQGSAGEGVSDIDMEVPANAPPNTQKAKASLAPYIAVALFLSLVAGTGVLLATSAQPFEGSESGPANAGKGAARIAAMVFSTSVDGIESLQVPSTAPMRFSMTEGEDWPNTVERFKQLLAQQQTSRASAVRQAENNRLLGQLDAWLKAKSR
jgi:hypothetical protein